jgi:hypothetical protein
VGAAAGGARARARANDAGCRVHGGEPLVDNPGALPDDVGGGAACGGGRGLPIPDWMTRSTMRVSIEQDVEPWFEAVCALWDDAALYESIGARARQIAEARYAERVLRHSTWTISRRSSRGGRPPRTRPPSAVMDAVCSAASVPTHMRGNSGALRGRLTRAADLRVYMIVPIRQDRYRARGCASAHREKENTLVYPAQRDQRTPRFEPKTFAR